MNYLLKENPINARPEHLLEDAKTIVMFSANYYSECPPRPSLKHGRIAAYAVGLDYHKVLRKKIKLLIEDEDIKPIFDKSKFFTDAVPLLEKSFARKAGLGFRGKNTLLISRETGSFNFIAEIITDLDLVDSQEIATAASQPRDDDSTVIARNEVTKQSPDKITCGNCTRCMDICPTNALPENYQLDARKCISYHTIENRGEIPKELSKNFGEWFFGCDLCQTICPYNKKASAVIARSEGTRQSPNSNKIASSSTRNDNETINIPIFEEFKPSSGFGHWLNMEELIDLDINTHKDIESLQVSLQSHTYIDKTSLIQINNLLDGSKEITEDLLDSIFQIKFARTPLLRPKRYGLIRNAKIVLQK
jgi:epoxyqueuosine reductase